MAAGGLLTAPKPLNVHWPMDWPLTALHAPGQRSAIGEAVIKSFHISCHSFQGHRATEAGAP